MEFPVTNLNFIKVSCQILGSIFLRTNRRTLLILCLMSHVCKRFTTPSCLRIYFSTNRIYFPPKNWVKLKTLLKIHSLADSSKFHPDFSIQPKRTVTVQSKIYFQVFVTKWIERMKIQVFKITSFLLLLGFVWFCESFCGNTRRKFIPWKKKNLNAEIRTHTICFFSFSSNNKYWYVNLQIGGITAAPTTKKKNKIADAINNCETFAFVWLSIGYINSSV